MSLEHVNVDVNGGKVKVFFESARLEIHKVCQFCKGSIKPVLGLRSQAVAPTFRPAIAKTLADGDSED